MRRIVPKHVEKKRQRRNQFIVGGILIFIMFFSVVGYSFQGGGGTQDNSETITYNGLEFINQNGLWYLVTGNVQFSFKYNPEQTQNIGSQLNNLDSYSGKPLYISSEVSEAKYEISRNLYLTGIAQRIQPACPEEDVCEENLPIITCDNNFIIIRSSNETSITQENSCVKIQGPQERLIELTDEFLFKILEIK